MLWKAGHVMSCEMNEPALGREIRWYYRGDFHYSNVQPLRHLAEEEAGRRRFGPLR